MASPINNGSVLDRPTRTPREKEILHAGFQTESKGLVAQRVHISASSVRT